jgi:hypothetical protein
VVAKKIYADDGKVNIGQQKSPAEPAAFKIEAEGPLTPTGYCFAVGTHQARTGSGGSRLVREDTKASPRVHQKTPICRFVGNVYQGAGGDGVEGPPDD